MPLITADTASNTTLQTPDAPCVLAGFATPLSGFAVDGAPDQIVTLSIIASAGLLTADAPPNTTILGSGSSALLLSGVISQVDVALASLTILTTQPGASALSAQLLDARGWRLGTAAIPLTAAALTASDTAAAITFSADTLSLTGETLDGLTICLAPALAGASPPSIVLDHTTLGPSSQLVVTGSGSGIPRVAVADLAVWAGTTEFLDGTAQITLAIGATLVNQGTLTFAGSTAALTGAGTFSNNGQIDVQSGTPTIATDIAGTGTIAIAAGASLTVSGDVGAGQTIALHGTLALAGSAQIDATIADLGPGSAIVLSQQEVDSLSYQASADDNTGVLTLSEGGLPIAQLHLVGNYLPGDFTLSQTASGATAIGFGAAVSPSTIAPASAWLDVYRFFDTNTGTQFLTQSAAERAAIQAGRPDLVYEGVAMRSLSPAAAAADPDAAPVFRFFDTHTGSHFYTASTAERDQILATRSDLVWEQSATMFEDAAPHAGDIPVYRFFDSDSGAHFYTDNPAERASVLAARPDLIPEGIAFYTPAVG